MMENVKTIKLVSDTLALARAEVNVELELNAMAVVILQFALVPMEVKGMRWYLAKRREIIPHLVISVSGNFSHTGNIL